MSEVLRVTTTDGKYTVIQKLEGEMTFLRHGQPWPAANVSLAHSGLVLALAQEVADLRTKLAAVARPTPPC